MAASRAFVTVRRHRLAPAAVPAGGAAQRAALTVQVLDASGTMVKQTLPLYSNQDAVGHYVQHSFSLSPFLGQAIVLKFTGAQTLTGYSTSLFIDDTALNASRPAAGRYGGSRFPTISAVHNSSFGPLGVCLIPSIPYISANVSHRPLTAEKGLVILPAGTAARRCDPGGSAG